VKYHDGNGHLKKRQTLVPNTDMLPETKTIGFAEMVVERMGSVNASAIGVLLECHLWKWQQHLVKSTALH
jgi:hypothetical protein